MCMRHGWTKRDAWAYGHYSTEGHRSPGGEGGRGLQEGRGVVNRAQDCSDSSSEPTSKVDLIPFKCMGMQGREVESHDQGPATVKWQSSNPNYRLHLCVHITACWWCRVRVCGCACVGVLVCLHGCYGWNCFPPRFVSWSSNPKYLRMWSYLETGSL